eukprot:gnl/MRDRNA2_/MRDRNA2_87719_c0_seq1.p1 gnl/MRDRNA2_/MRDRNA2_87719_c0~~gnl/MRDRNA2_/MRDRNA2_87719_c0_seq1.p1  ORF type:complete len:174 (+),score=21.01 gnl/MRDRNA2_/MRDRNA2_87719_c0_seq1:94-615(+)
MGATQCCSGPEQASQIASSKLVEATPIIMHHGASKQQAKTKSREGNESSSCSKLSALETDDPCSFRTFSKEKNACTSDSSSIASISTNADTPPMSPKLEIKSKRDEGRRSSKEHPEKQSKTHRQSETRARSSYPKLQAHVSWSASPKYPSLAQRIERTSCTGKFHRNHSTVKY